MSSAAFPGQEVHERLADIVEDAATFAHRRHDAREVVVRQHHVRGLARDLRARQSHRDPDVGLTERRCIVHAVTCHRHDGAPRFPLTNDPDLVLGRGTRVNEILRRVRACQDSELPRDRAGGHRMVTCDHHRRDAGGTRGSHRLDGLGAGRVGNAHQSQQRGSGLRAGGRNRDREDAQTALRHLGVGLRGVLDACHA